MARVSVLIPSRNERFLVPTVKDLLSKAGGDVELVVVCDGYWEHGLPADTRLKILHTGKPQGMRPAINAAAQMATGDYLMKIDGHCLVAEGYDVVVAEDCKEDNWILTPRRYPLDAENWRIDESQAPKYPVDYEYLSYGLAHPDDPSCGFHGQAWTSRKRERADILLDVDMSSQGSCWVMSRKHWDRIGPMRMDLFGSFFGESQELGLRTQLMGGAMMRTKRTYYAHLRKSKQYGRGYPLGPNAHKRGAALMLRMCLLNEWPGQTRTIDSLIEDFWPVPGWPLDWQEQFQGARERYRAAA